jgi:hypothetical protein
MPAWKKINLEKVNASLGLNRDFTNYRREPARFVVAET